VRLVLDTNVLISAFVSRGLCSELLEHCARHHELITSDALIEELRGKLLGKFRLSVPATDQALAALLAGMEIVRPATLPARVSRDADDDVVIARAAGGACEAIITGDRDLLDLKSYGGILMLAPREFWLNETQPSPDPP
jgi:putative PIN family toxin of toxin-antitoxin system